MGPGKWENVYLDILFNQPMPKAFETDCTEGSKDFNLQIKGNSLTFKGNNSKWM